MSCGPADSVGKKLAALAWLARELRVVASGGSGINHGAVDNLGELRQRMWLRAAGPEDIQNGPTLYHQGIANEPAVAAPRDGFGTHHGRGH